MIGAQGSTHVCSQSAFMQRGTSPYELWYAGLQNQGALGTTGTFALGLIYAMPFVLSRPVTLSKISFEVTTGGAAGSRARVGIYRNTSPSILYPSSLVVDGGDVDATTTGVKTTSGLSIFMPAGMYWTVHNTGTAQPTLRSINNGGILGSAPFFGRDNTFALAVGVAAASAYGALPATYPAGSGINSSMSCVVAMEFT